MTTPDTGQRALDHEFARETIERTIEAFNAHDLDGFTGLFTDDVILEHSAAPATIRGRAEVKAFYGDLWRGFPDGRVDLHAGPFLDPTAPRGSQVWRFVGTNTGPINPPGFAATGRSVDIRVFEVAEVRDGRVSRFEIVIDMADFMRQLGLLAKPGSRAERAMVALQRLKAKASRRR